MSEISGRLGGRAEEAAAERIELEPNERGARWLRRHLAGGVVALTTVADGGYHASTITAVAMVSLSPPQFLISIEEDSQMQGWLRESGVFGLSFLPWDEQFLADQFAGFTPLANRHFQGIPYFTGGSGAPLLRASIGWADCRLTAELATGDHISFIGEVVALGRGEGADDPLIYYRNRYRRLA